MFTLVFALQLWVPAAGAAVNDFSISNFEADYYLDRDSDNRSTLKTVEKITAEFPQSNQNHGLERAIPMSYDGHSTHVAIKSVTDLSGKPLEYSTRTSNDNLVLRIGEADRYVHGRTSYLITYEQRDVTRYFTNVNSDEFYWDTNGTEWAVPIDALTVRLHLSDELAGALTGLTSCYQGSAGSGALCSLEKDRTVFGASAKNLKAYENMTLAIGFKPTTFADYQPGLTDKLIEVYMLSLVPISIIGLGLSAWFGVRWWRWSGRQKDLGTIIPEYLPPKSTSVAVSSRVITVRRQTVFVAQLIDFAVRGYIKLFETQPKSRRAKAQYTIKIVRDTSDLLTEEQDMLKVIFGSTDIGQKRSLKTLRNNTTVYNRMRDYDRKLKDLVRGSYEIRSSDTRKSSWYKKAGIVVFILAVVTLNPGLLIAATVALICSYTLWPLTDKGLGLKRYIYGLKMYIKVAETKRLEMLQSPEGAQKVQVDPNDPAQLVKLYERVLPYAVLFGEEKEWLKRIGVYYESLGSSPDWYTGQSAFNAAIFSASMSGFASSASYASASSSSSDSGGSSGGGFSGGGGGGGGGGGW